MNYAIQTKNLCKEYKGELRVSHLNLNIPSGCVYGFLGPNGAGKSTTMKMMLGLVKPTDGAVRILGKTMNEKNRLTVLSMIGSLIESPAYYGHLSGRENLEIAATLKGVNKKSVSHALEIVHLNDVGNKKVKHYSLGMKQRLGIACALLGNPKLILLDEPTNGLDPNQIVEIRHLIKEIATDHAVLLSTHILSEVQATCNNIKMIEQGKLVFSGSMDEFNNYVAPSTLIVTFDAAPPVSSLETIEGVARVEKVNTRNYRLQFDASKDISEHIVQLSVSNNWQLSEIQLERQSLDAIFAQLSGKKVQQ